MENIKVIDDWLETAQLICTKTDGKTKYDFSKFTFPLKFASKIYNYDLTLQKAQDNQQELKILINKLNNNYSPQKKEKKKKKVTHYILQINYIPSRMRLSMHLRKVFFLT